METVTTNPITAKTNHLRIKNAPDIPKPITIMLNLRDNRESSNNAITNEMNKRYPTPSR